MTINLYDNIRILTLQNQLLISIGKSIELDAMLTGFCSEFLKYAGCRSMSIWLKKDKKDLENIFNYPENTSVLSDAEVKKIDCYFSKGEKFFRQFKRSKKVNPYFAIPIGTMGFAIVFQNHYLPPEEYLRAFQPIFNHLAIACQAGLQYETATRLKQEAVDARAELAKLNAHLEQQVFKRTAALRQSEEKFRAVFEGTTDAIVVIDLVSKKPLFANKNFSMLSGYQSDKIHQIDLNILSADGSMGKLSQMSPDNPMINEGILRNIEIKKKEGGLLYCDIESRILKIAGEFYLAYFLRDVTQRYIAQQKVDYRIKFETIIKEIAQKFSVLTPKDLDHGIVSALGRVAEFTEVDRAYVFIFSDDHQSMSNTYEWIKEGVTPYAGKLQNISTSCYAKVYKTIIQSKWFYVDDINKLPDSWKNEKKEFVREKIRSLLLIPLRHRKETFGFFGFDKLKEIKKWHKTDINTLIVFSELLSGVFLRKKWWLEQAKHAKDLTIKKSLIQMITALSNALTYRDPYTMGHHEHVQSLAVAIAEEMELSEDQLETIRLGSLIHDVGKIGVPTELLNKSGELTPIEFEIIKTHIEVVHEILKDVEMPYPILGIIEQHHERLDGSGYPRGLKGDEIALEAQILAVADVVEAITSHRPYRPAKGIDAALKEIKKNRGKLYDSRVVDACLTVFKQNKFHFQDVTK